jgi:hypothetical protein
MNTRYFFVKILIAHQYVCFRTDKCRNGDVKTTIFNRAGTDVLILKIFSPKHLAKYLAFFTQNPVNSFKKLNHNIGYRENRHFSAEN